MLIYIEEIFRFVCSASVDFLSFCLVSRSVCRSSKGRGGGAHAGGRDGGRGGKKARDRDRDGNSSSKALPRSLMSTRMHSKVSDCIRPEVSSMPLQKIFMTNENQEQLKELLRNLQTQDSDELYE